MTNTIIKKKIKQKNGEREILIKKKRVTEREPHFTIVFDTNWSPQFIVQTYAKKTFKNSKYDK